MSHPGNGDWREYQGHVSAHSGGVVQLELGLGRNAVTVLWLSCITSAAAVIGLIVAMIAYGGASDRWSRDLAAAEARWTEELRAVKAKYEVLQYDHQALKAQLVEAGVYEGTEH